MKAHDIDRFKMINIITDIRYITFRNYTIPSLNLLLDILRSREYRINDKYIFALSHFKKETDTSREYVKNFSTLLLSFLINEFCAT